MALATEPPPSAEWLKERYPDLNAFMPGYFDALADKMMAEFEGRPYHPPQEIELILVGLGDLV